MRFGTSHQMNEDRSEAAWRITYSERLEENKKTRVWRVALGTNWSYCHCHMCTISCHFVESFLRRCDCEMSAITVDVLHIGLLLTKVVDFYDSFWYDWVKVLRPTRHKIINFEDILPSQLSGIVLAFLYTAASVMLVHSTLCINDDDVLNNQTSIAADGRCCLIYGSSRRRTARRALHTSLRSC